MKKKKSDFAVFLSVEGYEMKCCEVCNAVWIADAPAFPIPSCSFSDDETCTPQTEMVSLATDVAAIVLPTDRRPKTQLQRYCSRVCKSKQRGRKVAFRKNGNFLAVIIFIRLN